MPRSDKFSKDRDYVLGVFYLYYPSGDKYQKDKPIRALESILSRFKCKKTIFYIDNSSRGDYARKISDNEYELSGDNSFFEFSGWQRGIDFSKKKNLPCDAFLFVNDKFLYSSFFHRQLVNPAAMRCAIGNNAMVGKRMFFSVSGQIMGNPLIPYVRTHIFMLSKKVTDALGSIVSIDRRSLERFFIANYDPTIQLFRLDAPVSQEIKEFIFSHVTMKWYRKKPYESENFEVLRNKAASILNSMLLSLRVRQLGYPLIALDKTEKFFSKDFSINQINQSWFKEKAFDEKTAIVPTSKFWAKNALFYRHLPPKQPTKKILENLSATQPGKKIFKNFLKRILENSPGHL